MTAKTSDRYVPTKATQRAVGGHEVEIVNELGIPSCAGLRTHLQCPYPGHGGTADWHLTPKGRGVCTCTDSKTDRVFDIAGKVEGLASKASKIRCVEIIGHIDLIRTKASGGDASQKTDAASLMNAPDAQRDDTLPRVYLEHCLGIQAATVLMPITPPVGFRILAYFNPPKGKGKHKGTGKLTKVGECPCIVFRTVNADGRQHAHKGLLAYPPRPRSHSASIRFMERADRERFTEAATAAYLVLGGTPAADDA